MPRHLVYFAHAEPATARHLYDAAFAPLGEVDLVFIDAHGLSSAYERLGEGLRGADGRVLPGLRARYPAPHPADAYGSLSLLTYSAGYGFARALLSSPEDRD